MTIACLDLEGVLIPEIWINLAEKTGIEALKLTTRDIADYDELMGKRLEVLDEHGLTLKNFQEVVATMDPLEGARDFLEWLQDQVEVIILSDTFREFAMPLIAKLGNPTMFCHSLSVDYETYRIKDYVLRQNDQKRKAVIALKGLNFRVLSMGDSYNDLSMLEEADAGIFFKPTKKIIEEFPQFPVTENYEELKSHLCSAHGFRR
ncbi:bifunctional phosphoserine phosphatase/homoserine phosphotransferase ThrH [Candidatus Pelagisphaera phototrophica]|uniref:bifunctional phosphoserine phosphatase/homoserine phosphotransferase ThrH n=1 Tax=Candidatus Pelagisphaera phototrophica TaxID=2684113 RepID=UPI0019F4FAF7|nr:bifunctional phosphoserine phosphatase/homoserine phosphotransferase ThrH [Candidatus Pelagisphaera phototrophica]